MSARDGPKTTVLDSCVFEREPETGNIDRFSVKKRAVLMTRNFAADVRLLEDVHRLHQQRSAKPIARGKSLTF